MAFLSLLLTLCAFVLISTQTSAQQQQQRFDLTGIFGSTSTQSTTTEPIVDTKNKTIEKLDEKIGKIELTIASIKSEMMNEITKYEKQTTQSYQYYDDMNVKTEDEDVDRKFLNADNAFQLNKVYEELVVVYKSKIEELTKKIEEFSCNCTEQQELTTVKGISLSDIETTTERKRLTYEWVKFYSGLPEYAVIGGNDIDGSYLYVARSHSKFGYSYGKLVSSTTHAFVTDQTHEYYVTSIEVSKALCWLGSPQSYF